MWKCLEKKKEKGIKARELFEMIYRRLLISFVVDAYESRVGRLEPSKKVRD